MGYEYQYRKGWGDAWQGFRPKSSDPAYMQGYSDWMKEYGDAQA